MGEKTCCVTGHRDVPVGKEQYVEEALRKEVLAAIAAGYTRFISGFADGVDLTFAAIVAAEKKQNSCLQLEAALPYRNRITPNYPREIFESVETALKYEGYIKRQLQDIAEMRRLEKKLLPKEINYAEISGLRLEAQEKLNRVRPENVGQAGRISGVSPADISVLLIWLSAHNEGK